jgi:hypothetical protein
MMLFFIRQGLFLAWYYGFYYVVFTVFFPLSDFKEQGILFFLVGIACALWLCGWKNKVLRFFTLPYLFLISCIVGRLSVLINYTYYEIPFDGPIFVQSIGEAVFAFSFVLGFLVVPCLMSMLSWILIRKFWLNSEGA